ncbi:peptide chain release factor N(5)-glutamine methyltransferase [Cohnella massiliensis]|uniref:peptide chain release factor N(5)-glutamine methyltransferase n=1 Tax=Cohnella massiliensis TaxID=1816691 RepID=UPI0009BB7C21|nr:peptide chain release factor N(5)-glutamine methyltransferase [Cohnella massiliensis]
MTEKKAATIGETWRQGAERLRSAGIEEAEANAELLLLHALGIGKAELLRDMREPFPPERAEGWERLLERKAAGEPVQYILGGQYFYGRWFAATPDVLIPRPETELLAEAVLAEASGWEDVSSLSVLDVGTGSGALAVTLAAERPNWRVAASDLSAAALAVARGNAERHGVHARIDFVQGDLLEPFIAGRTAVDVLVSNPPYIRSGDIAGLQREVRDFEPHLALDGGADGLAPYRSMALQIRALPDLPRLIAWEVGAGQAPDVAVLLRQAADWREIRFVRDFAGIDRHVLAVRG